MDMELRFISHIRKGNKIGVGFFYVPQNKTNLLNFEDRVKVGLGNEIYFYSKIARHNERTGIYIPRHIMMKNDLLDKEMKIHVEKIDGFYAPIASDGRVYIPYDIVKNESLYYNNIIFIKAIDNNKIIQEEYVKIYVARRPKRKYKEFICYVEKNLSGKTLVFRIEKLSSVPRNGKLNPLVAKLLQDTYYAFIDENSAIIFKGNKTPAIVNLNVKYSDIAFYLGAYFADGTKIGNSWAICASTFEQAKYYLKMHSFLIRDSKPEYTISYTNIDNAPQEESKESLTKIWESEVGIKVDKFRIRKPSGKLISKWNKYGTLIIREHRQILLDIYNTLLKLLIKEILTKRDKKLAIDFICGVMEGDGCVPARKRGHIIIWTNRNDIGILEDILRGAQIKFCPIREDPNKYGLRIGALEIMRNFSLIKDKVFIFYPKRRRALFERLKTVKAFRSLIENYNLMLNV